MLTLLCRRFLSYKNHWFGTEIDWFLYDKDLRHESIKCDLCRAINLSKSKVSPCLFTPSFKYCNVGYRLNRIILKLKFRLLYVLEFTNNYSHRKRFVMVIINRNVECDLYFCLFSSFPLVYGTKLYV